MGSVESEKEIKGIAMRKQTIVTVTGKDITEESKQALNEVVVDFLGEAQHIYKRESLESTEALKDILKGMDGEDAQYLLIDWN